METNTEEIKEQETITPVVEEEKSTITEEEFDIEDCGDEDLEEENEENPEEETDVVEEPQKKLSISEELSKMSEVASNDDLSDLDDFEVTAEDAKTTVDSSSIKFDNEDFEISDESAFALAKLMNRIKNKEKNINIYAEYPQEIKDMINKFLADKGISGFSVEANTARNSIAKALMDEFMDSVSINHTINSFNSELENMFSSVGSELSSLYKDYDNERTNYLQALLEKIPEDDPKREVLVNVLDSIHDSYALQRLKDAVPNMKKVRTIEMDKPQQRIFDPFKNLYKDSPYNMYDPELALDVLNRHNPENNKNDNLKFLITFCKFCLNNHYKPENTPEHAFMYYTIYNIFLLDIYKDKEYDEFAPEFLKNINEIISMIKSD